MKTIKDSAFSNVAKTEPKSSLGSFDIVGDIAIIRAINENGTDTTEIAKEVMNVHKNVKAVFSQSGPVAGSFRLRNLVHIAGENKSVTVHKESGCSFEVDIRTCYFSPRLIHERMRIAHLVSPGENIANMFAGVGCFSIVIAKNVKEAKVYSIDLNPVAFEFMKKNVRLNRVYGNVVPILGDAKQVVDSQLEGTADRVLMPLPEKACDYLPCAVSALKPKGGWIHVHAFEHAAKAENPTEKARSKCGKILSAIGVDFSVLSSKVVRSTGPNWWHVVTDVKIG